MKLTLFIIGFLFLCTLSAQNATLDWANAQGGVEAERGTAICIDSSGNSYVTGYFSGTVDLDPGPGVSNFTTNGSLDVFIQKLDPSGALLWVKVIENPGLCQSFSIILDHAGDVIVSGVFTDTTDFDPGIGVNNINGVNSWSLFILKLDSAGNFIWVQSSTPKFLSGAVVFDLVVDTLNNIYSVGRFSDSIDFDSGPGTSLHVSNGSDDVFILKFDSSGMLVWSRSYGGAQLDTGVSIGIDDAQNLYVVGDFKDTVDFDIGPGTHFEGSGNTSRPYVLKINSLGEFIWVKTTGGSAGIPRDLAVSPVGNIYVTGQFYGTLDFDPGVGVFQLSTSGGAEGFIQKLDSSGSFLWAKKFGGGSNWDVGHSIVADSSNCYLTGSFGGAAYFGEGLNTIQQTAVGNSDIFVAKYSNLGDLIWCKGIGGNSYDLGLAIAIDTNKNVFSTGYFRSTVDFDPNSGVLNFTAASGTDSDFFVLKLNQCNPYFYIDSVTSCGPFQWIDGVTYANSNSIATDTIFNPDGCDSIVTLNLTIANNSGTDVLTACDSLSWIDGVTYYSTNNTATHILTNSLSCDSVVQLDLTVNYSSVSTDLISACDSILWLDGNIYTSNNNVATHILVNSVGCDSLISLDLTINDVDETVSVSGSTITSNQVGASYNWLDCDAGYAIIFGETSQSFTPSINGNYAVKVSEGSCLDTSECTLIVDLRLDQISSFKDVYLYPNPSKNLVYLVLDNYSEPIFIEIMNPLGEILARYYFDNSENEIQINYDLPAGTYYLNISNQEGMQFALRFVNL